ESHGSGKGFMDLGKFAPGERREAPTRGAGIATCPPKSAFGRRRKRAPVRGHGALRLCPLYNARRPRPLPCPSLHSRPVNPGRDWLTNTNEVVCFALADGMPGDRHAAHVTDKRW